MTEENQEIETEEVVQDSVQVERLETTKAETGSEDELGEYSKNVQSRIKRLTEKYSKEERDREEAVRLSQQLLEENKKLKGPHAAARHWLSLRVRHPFADAD